MYINHLLCSPLVSAPQFVILLFALDLHKRALYKYKDYYYYYDYYISIYYIRVNVYIFIRRKLRWVLTNRLIKFFLEQAKRDKEKYLEFYDSYGLFFREGIVTTPEQEQRV